MNFAPFLDPTERHGADSHSWHPSRSVVGECPNSLNSAFRVELVTVLLDARAVFFLGRLLLLRDVLLWSSLLTCSPSSTEASFGCALWTLPAFQCFGWTVCSKSSRLPFLAGIQLLGCWPVTPSEMWDALISSTLFLVSGCSGSLPSSSFCISWRLPYPAPQLNF